MLRGPTGRMPGPLKGHPPSELEQAQKAQATSPPALGGWPSSSKRETADEAPSLNWPEMTLGLNPPTTGLNCDCDVAGGEYWNGGQVSRALSSPLPSSSL